MKKFFLIVLYGIAFILYGTPSAGQYVHDTSAVSEGPSFEWPDHIKMALSLTFDDGRPSQVDTGIPIMDKYNVKGTFYVSPDWMMERIAGWKQAASNGHEIGNHSLVHPCSGNFKWAREKALENYSLISMARELEEANTEIQRQLNVNPVSFAYPCGQTYVGSGESLESYVPLVSRLFGSGRTWLDESANDPVYCDLARLSGVELDNKSFEDIRLLIESAKQNGSWLVLAGHDIGAPGFQTSWATTLEAICQYASDPANGIWLAPVNQIADYVRQNRHDNDMKKEQTETGHSKTLMGKLDGLTGIRNFPHVFLSNDDLAMKLYLPDPGFGYYRATRFDWSGIIASLKYKGHEFFGEWKDTQDPLVHEDLSGPVESYNDPGLGYVEAKPGQHFVRIGVGVLEKPDEDSYRWDHTYKIIDHGEWTVNYGKDWIIFTHTLQTDFGYGYQYSKEIRLKENDPGFTIKHTLKNTGEKLIETDQYNHNFLVMDGQVTGPDFTIKYPYDITVKSMGVGEEVIAISGNKLTFKKPMNEGNVWLELAGFDQSAADHRVEVYNEKTQSGIRFSMDKPLYRMVFWAAPTTLSPENFIMIHVEPGKEDTWTSDYTVFK